VGALGGEVHRGLDDAGDAAQRRLHAPDARGAAHAADREREVGEGDLVAQLGDALDQPAGSEGGGVEGHVRALGREIDRGLADAG
jgi:hypothetical protein